MNTPGPDPSEEIRSDLWHTMDLKQLIQQQELISKRRTAVYNLIAAGMSTPTTLGLKAAMEYSMDTVNNLISKKLLS